MKMIKISHESVVFARIILKRACSNIFENVLQRVKVLHN